jgi:hypothetical protein
MRLLEHRRAVEHLAAVKQAMVEEAAAELTSLFEADRPEADAAPELPKA